MNSLSELKAFCNRTGDAQVLDLGVYDGWFSVTLELDPRGEEYVVRCPARRVQILEHVFAEAHLRLQDVNGMLEIVKGRYAPPRDFGAFMKAVNNGAWLALGERQSESTMVLRVISGSELARVLVRDVSEVSVEELK